MNASKSKSKNSTWVQIKSANRDALLIFVGKLCLSLTLQGIQCLTPDISAGWMTAIGSLKQNFLFQDDHSQCITLPTPCEDKGMCYMLLNWALKHLTWIGQIFAMCSMSNTSQQTNPLKWDVCILTLVQNLFMGHFKNICSLSTIYILRQGNGEKVREEEVKEGCWQSTFIWTWPHFICIFDDDWDASWEARGLLLILFSVMKLNWKTSWRP